MSELRCRMISDRHLRDSARALVEADVENLKTTYSQKGLTARAMDMVREGAVDIYEEAVEVADDNRGALAALIAAIVVWFARNPILSLFGLGEDIDPAPDDTGS
ncbi:hypothetical protein [Erythrobacter mangrovi]|uniref:Uncharacterized protein n=1 Tax=Erythrobacter mangrovi TaxID=2739433 RepID=A0A7D4CMP3_9SPHN|nr:hypothetical protein [Erythrobacter mangrovi]QKG71508.1 hypothetical protein HQR01_09115 [Erythrobacter mangrovi]